MLLQRNVVAYWILKESYFRRIVYLSGMPDFLPLILALNMVKPTFRFYKLILCLFMYNIINKNRDCRYINQEATLPKTSYFYHLLISFCLVIRIIFIFNLYNIFLKKFVSKEYYASLFDNCFMRVWKKYKKKLALFHSIKWEKLY